MFYDKKGGENQGRIWQLSPKKSSSEQASWKDKERKNAYKMGEGYHRKGVEKYQEKGPKEERDSEKDRSFLFLLNLCTLGKKLNYLPSHSCNLALQNQLFKLFTMEFPSYSCDKWIVQVSYLRIKPLLD